MIISHEHKFIFLQNGKCATTSMTLALKQYDQENFRKHDRLSVMSEKANFDYSNYFIFCFVKNPWARTLSIYKQMQKPQHKVKDCAHKSVRKFLYNLSTQNRFPDFIKKIPESYIQNWQQHYYYLLEDGNPIDFIGKFENLKEDFDIACDKIGIPKQKLPHKNKSQHKHYTEHYDDEAREIVTDKFKKDIKYFGYKFGE